MPNPIATTVAVHGDCVPTTLDPQRRQVPMHQAAAALPEGEGVLPGVFLRNTWAGRRDRVVYDPSAVNHAAAVHARPPN